MSPFSVASNMSPLKVCSRPLVVSHTSVPLIHSVLAMKFMRRWVTRAYPHRFVFAPVMLQVPQGQRGKPAWGTRSEHIPFSDWPSLDAPWRHPSIISSQLRGGALVQGPAFLWLILTPRSLAVCRQGWVGRAGVGRGP